nr:pyrroline-5-carboxylate reductase [Motiliproteus sp. SC1-56]
MAFIGVGNMASAIIGGLLANGYPPRRIWATARSADKLERLHADWGVQVTTDNEAAVRVAEVVVLAVKPQMFKDLCVSLREAIAETKPLVVSVAAGVLCSSLEQWLGRDTALVRCMPNTPSLVQSGASGLYANAAASTLQKQQAERVMKAVGLTVWVEEEALLDAVTAVSGSGPAYYFLFMEAMIAAGQKLGLSDEVSAQLTLQTALGAARMAQQSDLTPAELRRRVCSPNGTTERAIKAFQAGGLEPLVEKAMQDCVERAREMAEELGRG